MSEKTQPQHAAGHSCNMLPTPPRWHRSCTTTERDFLMFCSANTVETGLSQGWHFSLKATLSAKRLILPTFFLSLLLNHLGYNIILEHTYISTGNFPSHINDLFIPSFLLLENQEISKSTKNMTKEKDCKADRQQANTLPKINTLDQIYILQNFLIVSSYM